VKKVFFKVLIILLFLTPLFISLPVFATHPCPPPGKIALCNPLSAHTLPDLINKIIDFIFFIAIALAPLLVLIAGFYFITSGGDPGRVKTAKDIILYTFIGLLIIFLAKGIISVIQSFLS